MKRDRAARLRAATAPASRAGPRAADMAYAAREAARAPALRRPSIHPGFRNRLVAAEELRAKFNALFPPGQQFEMKARPTNLRMRLRDHVAHLGLVERHC